MPKFQNKEELSAFREELDSKYESGLPDYLKEYFDQQEKQLESNEFFTNLAHTKATSTSEEKQEWKDKKAEEFWKENTARIFKVNKGGNPIYEEPPKAEERVEQEKELSQEEIDALINLSGSDIELFAMRYFPHYLKKPSSRFHKFLYHFLSRTLGKRTKRFRGFKKAIAAPRGNAKSSLISGVLPTWCVCYNKKKFIIIVSDSADQAEDFLEDIKKELLHNEALARDFPFAVGKGPVWKRGRIVTRNGIQILALGSGSRIRGRKFGKDRPDLVILDDVENDEMVRSEATRKFIRYQWFNKGVLNVGEADSSDVDFLFVGTMNGKDCLLNALLDPEQYPDWDSNRFQAVDQFPINLELWDEWENTYKDRFNKNRKDDAWNFYLEHKEEMDEGAKVLWPEGDPLYGLMVAYISDPSGFASEKQNDPLDPTKLLTPIDTLAFLDFRDPDIQKILKAKTTEWFGSLDPSLGKNSSSDFSCIPTIARDKRTGIILVVDFDIKRRVVDKQIEAVLKVYEKYHHKLIVCETNLFQIVLKDNIVKESRKRHIYAPIEGVDNYKDKHARIESIVPLIKDGTIIFDSFKYKTNQQYALAIEQISEYYEGVAHDDAYDALEMCVRICKKKRFKMLTK